MEIHNKKYFYSGKLNTVIVSFAFMGMMSISSPINLNAATVVELSADEESAPSSQFNNTNETPSFIQKYPKTIISFLKNHPIATSIATVYLIYKIAELFKITSQSSTTQKTPSLNELLKELENFPIPLNEGQLPKEDLPEIIMNLFNSNYPLALALNLTNDALINISHFMREQKLPKEQLEEAIKQLEPYQNQLTVIQQELLKNPQCENQLFLYQQDKKLQATLEKIKVLKGIKSNLSLAATMLIVLPVIYFLTPKIPTTMSIRLGNLIKLDNLHLNSFQGSQY